VAKILAFSVCFGTLCLLTLTQLVSVLRKTIGNISEYICCKAYCQFAHVWTLTGFTF